MRYGMIIDLDRCIGCDACTVACKQANGTPPDVYWCRVEREEVGVYPTASIEYTPLLCMHCENAPCVEKCPTGASHKREKDGLVLIDDSLCIGCNYCIAACPYGARFFDYGERKGYYPEKGKTNYEIIHDANNPYKHNVSKCSFCADRLDRGDEPACVHTCPTDARIFGDLDSAEMQKRISDRLGYRLKSGQGTNPSVYYLPRKHR